MKHFKQEVNTIKTDFECGISLEDSTTLFQRGDKLICYKETQEPQTVKWDVGF